MELFQPPEGNKPPPPLIRAILIFTCTGGKFCAWFKRWSKRHGFNHVDFDWIGAVGLLVK